MLETLTKTFVLKNRKGLHARASANFVKIVESHDADVRVIKGEDNVPGASLMSLMMLGAGVDEEITVEITGQNSNKLLKELENLIENKFYEE